MVATEVNINSFTEAYSLYYSHVYNTIYSRIKNADSTHDLCQELFIRFYEKFDTIEHHRAWLFSGIKFVLLEYFKKDKGDNVDIDEILDDARMSFVNGFRDTRIMIEEALNSIDNFGDESSKQLFDLIALYNYTYKEASEHLGISERQARYRYGLINDKIIDYFRKKGVKGMEDIL